MSSLRVTDTSIQRVHLPQAGDKRSLGPSTAEESPAMPRGYGALFSGWGRRDGWRGWLGAQLNQERKEPSSLCSLPPFPSCSLPPLPLYSLPREGYSLSSQTGDPRNLQAWSQYMAIWQAGASHHANEIPGSLAWHLLSGSPAARLPGDLLP